MKDDYTKAITPLLKKCRLSADAFRHRFRKTEYWPRQSFSGFVHNLKSCLREHIKGEQAFGTHDKVVEVMEQSYSCLREETRVWVPDRSGYEALERTAELVEELHMRWESEKGRARLSAQPIRKFSRGRFHNSKAYTGRTVARRRQKAFLNREPTNKKAKAF